MSKTLNAFIEKAAENDTRVTKLTIVDFTNPNGAREKTVVKPKHRDPQVKVVVEVREVTYLYSIKHRDENGTRYETKTTKGFEIVKEISVSQSEIDSYEDIAPRIVSEVTRDLRKQEKDATTFDR